MPHPSTTSPATDVPVAPAVRRRRLRARSQRLLITVFGDYWQPEQPPLPSAGLVRVLEEFGITPANTRASLSRLTQRDLLCRTKDGRRTSYGLTDYAWRLLVRGARRIFADEDAPPWDGTWTLVAFSVPGADSEQRRLLRARLRWLTLWPLYDGSWITPHDRVEAVQEQLDELAITDALVIRTRDVELLPTARARLEETWDLPKLACDYDQFIGRYRELADRAEDGAVTPADALVLRTGMVDEWRRMVRDDPDVPEPLLPAPFPRPRARVLFLRAYRALEVPARDRFDRLVNGRATAGP